MKREIVNTSIALVTTMVICLGFTLVLIFSDIYPVQIWLALFFSLMILVLIGIKLIADMVEYEIKNRLESLNKA